MESQSNFHFWEEIPDAVVVLSKEGKIIYWNKTAEEIFGYTKEEVLGTLLIDSIIPKENILEEKQLLEKEIQEYPITYESIRKHKKGPLIYVNITIKAVCDKTGAFQYFISTKKDITHLKFLRDTKFIKTKYYNILESTPDAIVIVNITGKIALANSQTEAIFGYTCGELIGKSIEILLPKRFHNQHISHRANFFSQPRKRTMGAGMELYAQQKNGKEFPVEISLSPLETEEGMFVMSAIRDISDRKKSAQKFKDLLEAAPDAMVIVNPEGNIVLINSQTVKLFGWKPEEILGQKIELLVPKRFREAHPNHRTQFFKFPKVRSMGVGLELYGLRKDASEFPVEISLSPIETEEGLFVSSTIRDATERKHFEKTIQEANRLKSEFLANMSHELRTPLNGIIGFSEILIDERPGTINQKQKEYLNIVLKSGLHLLHLINNILDLSKVEAGKMELLSEIFMLSTALNDVCAIISPMAKKKNIQIFQDISSEIKELYLDQQKFKQILYNLLSNAVKFTNHGGQVTIIIRPHHKNTFRLEVHDTGIGIHPSDLGKLFVAFQQLDTSIAKRHQGTGLGLAITKKIVECQKGSISVESQPGKGSIFTIILPLSL